MAIDILVVEDEYTERQELTQLLETVTPPEHIRSAATCSAAIAAISQLCPDLILLDIMLRGSSGFEVAEFVRSNRLDCKIIILTELERQQVQKSCRYRAQRPYVRPCEPLCGLFRSGAAFPPRREVSNHFWAASSALGRTKEEAGKNFKTGARAQVFGIQKYAPG